MPASKYPNTPGALRRHLTRKNTRAALQVKNGFLAGSRQFLAREGFTELLPTIVGPATDPGTRGANRVNIDYYGRNYNLMTSGILYKQASLLTFDRIFHIAPNVRLESEASAVTHRHLVEFHQLDVEIAQGSRDEAMDVAERMTKFCIEYVLTNCQEPLNAIGRDSAEIERVLSKPYGRITHEEAINQVDRWGGDQERDSEISWQNEEKLSKETDHPFFIVDYPVGSRGFYDKVSSSQPNLLNNFDLIFPSGFGEMISGSERESEYRRLRSRLTETGEDPTQYAWYLDLAYEGIPPSSGFGLGVERFTRFLCGLESTWQATQYPKLPGKFSP